MDWIAPFWVVDPDHYQPPARRCPTDHLIGLAIDELRLDPIDVAKRLFDFRNRDVSFRMIGAEVLSIGIVPDDWPIVHPFSIYEMNGQIGVASGI